MAEKGNHEIVKKYNNHIKENIADALSHAIAFRVFKADLVKKKTKSMKKGRGRGGEDPNAEITDNELSEQMPINMKISLYQQFKYRPDKGKVGI
jgi:hypothetical protein